MAVFDVLFGWRKAAKCKKLIRRVQSRLRLLRNRRESIVRQSRCDVVRLVQMGYMEVASERAEKLLKDESVKELYDLLDHFCEFIITNLSYIRRHRECPNGINEAVSSLIFASARCGDLPELRRIRELFRERYGDKFTTSAIDLLPGNLVNSKIRGHLSLKSISGDSKSRREDECTRDQVQGLWVQPETMAIEYASELHKQREEMAGRQEICRDVVPISPKTTTDLEEEDVTATETEKRATFHVAKSQSHNPQVMNSTGPGTEFRTSVWCSEGKERRIGLEKASEQREGTVASSSGESSPRHFPELKVVYLDDVVELQSAPKGHNEGLDQRFLKFKSPAAPTGATPEEVAADRYVKQCERSGDENVSPQTKVVPGKRLNWRSVSREPKTIKDKECATYYSARNGNTRKHLDQSPTEMSHPSLNPKTKYDNPRPAKVTSVRHQSRRQPCLCSETEDHKVFYVVPNHARGIQGKVDVILCDSLDATDASTSSDSEEENILLVPGYSRAMTMPPKRQTPRSDFNDGGRMPRSNSCPFQNQPTHVHPKLPDYDELASRFSTLKGECLVSRPPKPRIGKHSQT